MNVSPKPPPLVCKLITKAALQSVIEPITTNYNLKYLANSVKIFSNDDKTFGMIKKKLIEMGLLLFTHRTKTEMNESKTDRFVLFGLDSEIKPESIILEMNHHEFYPTEVKPMTIKNAKFTGQANFIVYFKKSDRVTINDLQLISGISHIRVRWEKYRQVQNGPTQCRRCQSFGHGMVNCFKKPKCVKCSLEHLTSECPLKPITGTKLESHRLLCANCNLHHTASFSRCPFRLKYIESRQNTNIITRKSTTHQHLSTHNPGSFPPLPRRADNQLFTSIATDKPTSRPEFNQNQSANDLFRSDELSAVFEEMLISLKNCQTKSEQIKALDQIIFKYVYTIP